MLFHINDRLTTRELQREFSRSFPNLKIEFCRKMHRWEKTCPEHDIWQNDMPLGLIRSQHNSGMVVLDPSFKVGDVERMFRQRFGLNIQICYRSGRYWIQTGKSDNVSLQELQKKAYRRNEPVLL